MVIVEHTKELYVKVNDDRELDKLIELFDDKKIGCSNKGKYYIYNTYIYIDDIDFYDFLDDIIINIPDCLILASDSCWDSLTDFHGYTTYVKYPSDKKIKKNLYNNKSLIAYISNFGTPEQCLKWIEENKCTINKTQRKSLYKIFGCYDFEKLDSKKSNMDLDLMGIYKIADKKVEVTLEKREETFVRFCLVAKDITIFNKIKEFIEKKYNYIYEGINFVEKLNYMYVILKNKKDPYDLLTDLLDDLLNSFENCFILWGDCFKIYWYDDKNYSEEGEAILSPVISCDDFYEDVDFYRVTWDCYVYDMEKLEYKKNVSLNITDIKAFMKMYFKSSIHKDKIFESFDLFRN